MSRKYESTTQPGLFFWAEAFEMYEGVNGHPVYNVVAQATGHPASEAHDDWFAKLEDADQIAQQLARGAQ